MTSYDHLPAPARDALEADMTIDITTTGRRSGEPRRIEIWFLNVDGEIYITGTVGRRDWLANLAADPRLVFHLKETITADFAATATEVHDPAERRRVFEHPTAAWYGQQQPVDDLVDDAPMVKLRFD